MRKTDKLVRSFNGQPMAEKDQGGNWTDYIYASGQKIVRVAPSGGALHFSGTTGDSTECDYRLTPAAQYPVKQGDKLSWREYKSNMVGGIDVWFQNAGGIQWEAWDTNGSSLNQDHTTGQWQSRTLDLSPWAGDTILQYSLLHDVESSPSTWDIWVGDMAITSQDGTVTPVITDAGGPSGGAPGCDDSSNLVGEYEAQTSAPDAADGLGMHYYLADHLGSTTMEFAAGGWPLWAAQYAPFGQELDSGSTSMHYKFTGKERDAESGNDYFPARYYTSNMGRFMSPDYSDQPNVAQDGNANVDPVPYAHAEDPQTLNLYAYVQDNPLIYIDPDGHACQTVTYQEYDTEGNLTGSETDIDDSDCYLYSMVGVADSSGDSSSKNQPQHQNKTPNNPQSHLPLCGSRRNSFTVRNLSRFSAFSHRGIFVGGSFNGSVTAVGGGVTLGLYADPSGTVNRVASFSVATAGGASVSGGFTFGVSNYKNGGFGGWSHEVTASSGLGLNASGTFTWNGNGSGTTLTIGAGAGISLNAGGSYTALFPVCQAGSSVLF